MSAIATGTIPETTGTDRTAYPILGAVPLPRGRLMEGGIFGLRFEENGALFPVEGTPAAWWPDRSIKWLRLCGTVDLKGGSPNRFRLMAEGPTSEQGLAVRRLPGIVEVSGGPLAVRISPDVHRVLRVSSPDGSLWTRGPGLSASLRLVGMGQTSHRRMAWTFEEGMPRLVVESRERIVVRLAGRFVEEGRLVAELILFIEIRRGTSSLGLQPVWIYLGDPDRDPVAELSLTFHSAIRGEAARFGFGVERARGYWDSCQWLPDGPRWSQARLVQRGSSFWRLDKRTGPSGGWIAVREGRRARGWMHLGDAQGGVTGTMRYFWQEYPRALSVDADEGFLRFGLIPEEEEPLDLRRYSPVVLGSTTYESGEGAFPAVTHGATGIAKSSELALHFHHAGYAEREVEEAGLFWSEPARLLPDPKGFCESGVAGPIAAEPPTGYEEHERELVEWTDFLLNERDVQGWYGLLNWGDVMSTYYSDRRQWAFDDGGYAWLNTEGLPDLGLWLMAFRHASPHWFEGAIAMTRHNRDVDMYHRGPLKGLGSRHNVNHWGCRDKEWRISMPLVKRFHDYVTGDPWTREVILETVGVYQTYERTAGTAPSMASALAGLMVKAEMTGDERDFTAVRHLLDVFARAVGPDGQFVRSLHVNLATGEGHPVENGQNLMGSYFFLQTFGGQHALVEAVGTYGHEGLRQALIRFAELCVTGCFDETLWKPFQRPSPHDAMLFLTLAWRTTGDVRYRQAVERELKKGKEGKGVWRRLEWTGGEGLWDEPRRLHLAGLTRKNKITCSLGALMHLWPYGYLALQETL